MSTVKKVCDYCFRPFKVDEQSSEFTEYCSAECKEGNARVNRRFDGMNSKVQPQQKDNKRNCVHCGQPFDFHSRKTGEQIAYCSLQCREKDYGMSDFAKRLHDGTRLQSDDFGEEPGDDLVTYQ